LDAGSWDIGVIGVGLVGLGYWGPNLLRNLQLSPLFKVIGVAERDPERRAAALLWNLPLDPMCELGELIRHPDIDAIVVATPVSTHFELARCALERGKHVLVEKPLCATSQEAHELITLAERQGLTLMVDHTFLFNGAVQEIGRLMTGGEIGRVSYYDCMRVNLGIFQPDINVLWDLAPHDFAIMDYLIADDPVHIEVQGYCHVNERLPDIVYITAFFASSMVAHFNLSWMSPMKVRRTAIGGSRRMVIWDDLNRDEPVRVYDAGIQIQPEEQRPVVVPSYRIGDVHCPRVSNREPLAAVVEHFGRVIRSEERSIMDGSHGRRVVRMLERCQAALDISLARVGAAMASKP
jgi:predicted dehydrogenase